MKMYFLGVDKLSQFTSITTSMDNIFIRSWIKKNKALLQIIFYSVGYSYDKSSYSVSGSELESIYATCIKRSILVCLSKDVFFQLKRKERQYYQYSLIIIKPLVLSHHLSQYSVRAHSWVPKEGRAQSKYSICRGQVVPTLPLYLRLCKPVHRAGIVSREKTGILYLVPGNQRDQDDFILDISFIRNKIEG